MSLKSKEKIVFIGPSIGTSLLGFALFIILNLTLFPTMPLFIMLLPLWIGPVACFIVWFWFATIFMIFRNLKSRRKQDNGM